MIPFDVIVFFNFLDRDLARKVSSSRIQPGQITRDTNGVWTTGAVPRQLLQIHWWATRTNQRGFNYFWIFRWSSNIGSGKDCTPRNSDKTSGKTWITPSLLSNSRSLKTQKTISNAFENTKFTAKSEEDWKLAFLDVLVKINPNGVLETTVYRKPTHANEVLSLQSNHSNNVKNFAHRSPINNSQNYVEHTRTWKVVVKLPLVPTEWASKEYLKKMGLTRQLNNEHSQTEESLYHTSKRHVT